MALKKEKKKQEAPKHNHKKWIKSRPSPLVLNIIESLDFSLFSPSFTLSWGPSLNHVGTLFSIFWQLGTHTTYSWNISWQKCEGMGLNGFIFKQLNENYNIKVHIFWEGHKILRNLHLTFVLCSVVKSKVKISQNFVAFS